jgi:hypothetical protein
MYKSATNFVAEQLGIDFPTSQPGDGLAMCKAQVTNLKYLAGHGIEAIHHWGHITFKRQWLRVA